MIRFLAAALLCLFAFAPAEARLHHRAPHLAAGCNMLWPCATPATAGNDFLAGVRSIDVEMTKERKARRPARYRRAEIRAGITAISARAAGQVIGGRPPGCPRAFCGCGASLHLFGRIIPSLNLAANWLRFPRAAPAPDMVAARRHHVFVLKQHIAGQTWLVFDANSGGRRTRLHARSIAGFAIVDPRGAG